MIAPQSTRKGFGGMTFILLSIAALIALTTPFASAAALSFQQDVSGYTGTSTARLFKDTLNAARETTDISDGQMFAGQWNNREDNRSLISFDLSSYSGWMATSDATLTLTVSVVTDSPNASDFFDVYLVDSNNVGWQPNAQSWNYLNNTGPVLWKNGSNNDLPTTNGALGAPGDGYGSTALDTINQSSYTAGNTVSVTISSSIIQDWIDNPSDNAGLLIRKRNESDNGRLAFYFGNGTANQNPELAFSAIIPTPASLPAGLAMLGLVAARRRGTT